MSHFKAIRGPIFEGRVYLFRPVDYNRVQVVSDGLRFGLDVYLLLTTPEDDVVRLSVSNGDSSVPIFDAHTNGWRPLVSDGVQLVKPHELEIELEKRREFGGYSLYGTFVRRGGNIEMRMNLLPIYAPRMRFDAELELIGWKEPWKGLPWDAVDS